MSQDPDFLNWTAHLALMRAYTGERATLRINVVAQDRDRALIDVGLALHDILAKTSDWRISAVTITDNGAAPIVVMASPEQELP